MTEIKEIFPEFPPFGAPILRGWKHRKTMSLEWHEGSVRYREFESTVDCAAMNAALLTIWQHYKPQCDRRASFTYGNGVNGCMTYVPIAAGVEAMAVVALVENVLMWRIERSHQ